eukprot:COSAG01_NODE_269_length_19814_cov_109.983720_5_plen_210_part_00
MVAPTPESSCCGPVRARPPREMLLTKVVLACLPLAAQLLQMQAVAAATDGRNSRSHQQPRRRPPPPPPPPQQQQQQHFHHQQRQQERVSSAVAPTNMVRNPNFQGTGPDGSPAHWRIPHAGGIWARSTTVAFPPATTSLKYSSHDPKLYELVAQTLVGIEVGREYRFSAAIKTAQFNTSAGTGDATVCVQWDDHEGKWFVFRSVRPFRL